MSLKIIKIPLGVFKEYLIDRMKLDNKHLTS